MSMEQFHRIRRLPPYVFEQVNRAKAAARNAGADIIDLGMGNPDLPAPAHVVEKIKETLGKPRTDRYSASKGIAGLRRAQAAYYERRFGVKLNPETQVVTTLGSKEGFANVAQAITAPGDVVLVPNPSYPIHAFGFLMAGGVIRSVPSEPTPALFEALERAVVHSIPKPTALVVCYPANPTAYVVDLDFYKDVIAFAKRHGLIVLSDLAYAEVYFDGNPPPSILQVPGAMDVAVEFTSMSKTFSMPGWRIGFAVGNERMSSARLRGSSRTWTTALSPQCRWRRRPPSMGPKTVSTKCGKPISAGVTSWWRASGAPVGRFQHPAPRCLPGRRFRPHSARSGASSSRRFSSRRPSSPSPPASVSASTAKASCVLRSSKTSSASARRRAICAASSKPARTSCTTSFPLPNCANFIA